MAHHRASKGVRLPSLRHRLLEASIVLWMIVTLPLAIFMTLNTDRDWALAAVAAGPIALLLRRQPYLAAATIVAGAMILRLSFVGLSASDPIEVSQLAAHRALAGGDPYEGRYLDQGVPYPFGPLGLLTYQAGIPGEVLATIATSALLAWGRAWFTLALFNGWPQFIYMPVIGNNDFSVGFLTLAALIALIYRPKVGIGLLAAAIAIKPYAAAWALPAAVYAGWVASIVGLAVSAILWSPILVVWGVSSFIRAETDAEALRASLSQVPSWSFGNVPILRWLAAPLSLAAFVLHSWRGAVLLGAAVFVVFLGFAPRAPQPYLAFLLPIVGLAVEGRFTDLRPGRTAADEGRGWKSVPNGRDYGRSSSSQFA